MAESIRLIGCRAESQAPFTSATYPRTSQMRADALAMTIAEFVERRFIPDHVSRKATPGQRHYQAILKYVLQPEQVDTMFRVQRTRSKPKLIAKPDWPYIGHLLLRDLTSEDLQRLISAALHSGYSTQTVKHIRNAVSAIISLGIRTGDYVGANPAAQVSLPGMQRRPTHALEFSQTVKVLQAMKYPEWEITVLAILTGMTIAEICGLQWKYVNLSSYPVHRESEAIPPMCIAVRQQWYRGELSEVPKGRRKDLSIPTLFRPVFVQLSLQGKTGWNDFVLASKVGKPINQINLAARRLKVIGKQLNVPWLSWQVVRRTRTQLLAKYGVQLEHQLAMALPLKRGSVSGGSQPTLAK